MKKIIILITVLILAADAGCYSLYTTTKKRIVRGDNYQQRQLSYRALLEYSRALTEVDKMDDDAPGRFLTGALYYHLHLIDAVNMYRNAPDSVKSRHPYLGEQIALKPDMDFLAMACAELVRAENNPRSYNTGKVEPLLVAERGLIAGDYLMQAYARLKTGPALARPEHGIPLDFIDRISRYAYLDVARNFYLEAWATAVIISHQDEPPLNIRFISNLAAQRLRDTYLALVDVFESLPNAQSPRRLQQYKSALSRLEEFDITSKPADLSFDKDSNITSEKVCSVILGEAISKGDVVLDGDWHLQEMRRQMSQAITEMLDEKEQHTDDYLMAALKSLIRARAFSYNPTEETIRFLDEARFDIFLNLYRSFSSSEATDAHR
jgi:hypothetical protein